MYFTIASEYHKMRLDKFLKEHFPELSRSHLQKLIAQGQVTVNGKKATPHHFLKAGDEVEAVIEAAEELAVVANPAIKMTAVGRHPEERSDEGSRLNGRSAHTREILRGVKPRTELRSGAWAQNDEIVVEVIHEEPDFIVVNKPAGLVVHQGEGHKAPDTLVNGLIVKYPEIAKVGEDPVRPGLAHRLDADASGVMVIARTQDMFDHLKRQFKMHEVEKEYVAVVDGQVLPPEGVIEFAVARKAGKMVARPRGAEGKRAVTEYETLKIFKYLNMTMLRIVTLTGRMHQIRVHLKAIGHPIVGDRLYGKRQATSDKRQEGLMLHARKLAFKDLKGKIREFIIEPPQEFTMHVSHST